MAAESTMQKTGVYVYGILPGDVELTSDMTGVGDPPGQVRVVRSGDLAALISEVDMSGPLGSPEDLAAHKEILDASAADAPVLPMRFGAVVASEDAVTQELLDEHHDEFARALADLDGKAQYVIKGRYVGNVILPEVLSENRRAARLRDEIRGTDSDATREARIQLGEIINDAVALKREKDTRTLGKAMADHCEASLVRDPTHELDAVHVAFLVRVDQEKEIERAVKDLGEQWDGRVELRLLGPMAAYDFIAASEPGG
jgi:Gas vesicle synthesis protein GvpL/GvpF